MLRPMMKSDNKWESVGFKTVQELYKHILFTSYSHLILRM
jgi:hypothetical protein